MLVEYVAAWVPLLVLAFFWFKAKRQSSMLAFATAVPLTASAALVAQLTLPWRTIRPSHSAEWQLIVGANLFVSLASLALFGFKRMQQAPILAAAVLLSIYWLMATIFLASV